MTRSLETSQPGTETRSVVVSPDLPGQELREKVEIVAEWLAVAKETPPTQHSSLNYVPICASEIEAIGAILSALQPQERRPCRICDGTGRRTGSPRDCGACDGSGRE